MSATKAKGRRRLPPKPPDEYLAKYRVDITGECREIRRGDLVPAMYNGTDYIMHNKPWRAEFDHPHTLRWMVKPIDEQ